MSSLAVPSPKASTSTIADTLPSIWRLVGRHANPIVLLNKGATDPHLFCIHSITGDVAGLELFASFFGHRRVHGIQVPRGQMNGETASSIEAIARSHIEALASFQPKGPINLLGWSAGAVIALEMAQQLREMGRDVPLLIALDGAPCNTGAGLARWHPLYIGRLLANLPRWIRDDRTSDWSIHGVRQRIQEKLAFYFGRGAGSLRGGQTLDADTMNAVLRKDGWSADQRSFVYALHKAMLAYVPKAYAGPILVFETKTQPLFHLRQISAAWRKINPSAEISLLHGNHTGLIKQDAARTIARGIIDRLGSR